MAEETSTPIPGPPGYPFLGNIGDINQDFPLGSMVDLADKYGQASLETTFFC
jgi:cytochrome P450/NADPH-cytochrome P450 reductase